MPGKPDGTVAAPLSRTAVLVALAAEAALRGTHDRPAFIEEHEFGLGDRDIHRALELRRRLAGPKAPRDPDEREWVWDSLEADAAKLGLDEIVAWLPRPKGPGGRADQGKLLAALRRTPGVIDVHDCFDDTVMVRALAWDALAKRRLQSRLRELCPEVLWAEVRRRDRDQPARGWLHAALAVARTEGRLRQPRSARKRPAARSS